MTNIQRTHLDELENQSIFIFREAHHVFKNIAMPWSMGKDSNVLVWLARKAFFGRVPFPILHIDTTYEFTEMLEFREWATKHHNLNLIVKINTEARERGVGYETHDPVTVTHELKTVALQQALTEYKWARRSRAGPLRAECDAEIESKRLSMMSKQSRNSASFSNCSSCFRAFLRYL